MKNKVLLFVAILSVLCLTGCYDSKEIDETAYIVALGIDKGENENFSYTFQFSAPLAIMTQSGSDEKSGGSGEGGESSQAENSTVSNLVIDAPDFYIAKNMTNNFLSKNVDMSHLKLIVFSAEIEPEQLEQHSQLLLHEREIRPHTAIAVSTNKASDFLEKVNPELESNTSKYYELMSLRSNNVYAPTKRLHDFVDELVLESEDTVLPIATNGEELKNIPTDAESSPWVSSHNSMIDSKNSVLCGMAIFSDGKLSATMDGDSAMIYNILCRNIEDCTITLKDKYNSDSTVTFRITVPDPASFCISIPDKKIAVRQTMSISFLGVALPQGYSSFDELYSYANDVFKDRISQFLNTLSKKHGDDILGLRNHLRTQFSIWDEWKAFGWDDFYKHADFDISINFA